VKETLDYVSEKNQENLLAAIVEGEVKPLVYQKKDGKRVEIHHLVFSKDDLKESIDKIF